MASNQPTFRKQPRLTGLAGVGRPYPDTTVKLGGLQVGRICGPNPPVGGGADRDGWTCSLMVRREPTPAEPCPWRWARFKQVCATEAEARRWLLERWPQITAQYQLYAQEE